MAPHHKVVVEHNPHTKRDPRKIVVDPGTGPVPPPAVRGTRLRSVLRDQTRHALLKMAGAMKRAVDDAAAGAAVSEGLELEEPVEAQDPGPQGPFNRRRDVAQATTAAHAETVADEAARAIEEPPVEEADAAGTPTPAPVEDEPTHPIPGSTAPDGSPAPQAPELSRNKKPLTQAERQALLADARAKKEAKKAGAKKSKK